ncbi:MAG: M48 family metallopeptidase [Acidobacteriia bacterium]|nr:M48 family metallopeptidase [Terriglobia bacterium]
MHRNRRIVLLALTLLIGILAVSIVWGDNAQTAEPTTAPSSGASSAQTHLSSTPAEASKPAPKVEGYALTPEQRDKAIAYSKANYRLYFIDAVYGLALLYFLMRLQWPVKFAQWAAGSGTRRRFLQVIIFAPLFIATIQVMSLPVDYYGEHLQKIFGLSVQSLGSWFVDWLKGLAIGVVIGTLLIWILYGVIRRSPTRWWFYFWLTTIPITVFLIFLQPYVIEPLFYKFTPLQTTQPQVAEKLQQVVQRADLNIPESRMFEMNASSKTKGLNAYVSGLGSSKRVVVWDNTIQKMTPDEIAFVFGHESGHYVLNHIPKMIGMFLLIFLILFYLGYRLLNWAVPRWQSWSGVNSLGEWGSLTIIFFFLSILVFFSSPLINGISRHYEHQADVYGLEVTHGMAPDSPQVAAHAFQILGEVDLADPSPNSFIKFWLYSHPPLTERVDFALQYNPWQAGKSPEFVPVK